MMLKALIRKLLSNKGEGGWEGVLTHQLVRRCLDRSDPREFAQDLLVPFFAEVPNINITADLHRNGHSSDLLQCSALLLHISLDAENTELCRMLLQAGASVDYLEPASGLNFL